MALRAVETKEELDKIKILGADYIQGYYYSRPVELPDILEYDIWLILKITFMD